MTERTAEQARYALELLSDDPQVYSTDDELYIFNCAINLTGWTDKLLPQEEAIAAATSLAKLNGWISNALGGDWHEKARSFFSILSEPFGLYLRPLEHNERIVLFKAIITKIDELKAADLIKLSSEEESDLYIMLCMNIVGAGLRSDLLTPLGFARTFLTNSTAPVKSELSRKWRSVDKPHETAAQYFADVISPIPFPSRPTTTELADLQPDLYKALKSVCADQKRRGRVGEGEIGKATAISQLLPIGAPKRT